MFTTYTSLIPELMDRAYVIVGNHRVIGSGDNKEQLTHYTDSRFKVIKNSFAVIVIYDTIRVIRYVGSFAQCDEYISKSSEVGIKIVALSAFNVNYGDATACTEDRTE